MKPFLTDLQQRRRGSKHIRRDCCAAKESIVLCAPIRESSSIMMRDSPHSSKLLMSFFLSVRGLPRCLVYMWDWQKM